MIGREKFSSKVGYTEPETFSAVMGFKGESPEEAHSIERMLASEAEEEMPAAEERSKMAEGGMSGEVLLLESRKAEIGTRLFVNTDGTEDEGRVPTTSPPWQEPCCPSPPPPPC